MPDQPPHRDRRPLVLDARLLASHRGGRPLALARDIGARSYSLPEARGAAYALYRVRADGGPEPVPYGEPDAEPTSTPDPMTAGGVAVIDICGPLSQRGESGWCGHVLGYDDIAAAVSQACADARVSGLVLRFDSPGGDVPGMEECARRMGEALASSGKPCVAHLDEMAASAAYRIASVAETIIAPASGLAGSIDVMVPYTDASAAMTEAGLEVTIVSSLPGKALGRGEPMSPELLSRLHAIVDPFAESMIAGIAARRGISVDAIRALDARLLPGPAAIEAGLVDALGSLEDAIALVASRAASKSTASAPQLPAAPPAAAKGSPMKVSASLLALVPGLAADATDPAVEAAVLPRLALASAVLEATGESDLDRARGVLAARFADAARLADVAAELAEFKAAQAAQAEASLAAAEQTERLTLVMGMIKGGSVLPRDAWAQDANGVADPKLGPAPDLASMPIVALRTMAGKVTASRLTVTSSPDVTQALSDASALAGSGLTAEEHEICRRTGRDPAVFAATKTQIFGDKRAGKEA